MKEKQTYLRVMITAPLFCILAGVGLILAYWKDQDPIDSNFGVSVGILASIFGLIWLLTAYYALKEDWERQNASNEQKEN